MKFKVGDKVKCINNMGVSLIGGEPIIKHGKIYTITFIDSFNGYIKVNCCI